MVFPLTGIPGTSAAEQPQHGLFITHGRRGRRECRCCVLVRVVWVCVQGRREALYMTRRFHGNVVRMSQGVFLMELHGFMPQYECVHVDVYALNCDGVKERDVIEMQQIHSGLSGKAGAQCSLVWGVFFVHFGALTSFSASSSTTATNKGSSCPFSPS